MSSCKNKGTEPSPKGLGYCARNETVNNIRKGKDGNKWVVKELKNGSKRWLKINFLKLEKEALKEFKNLKKNKDIEMIKIEGLEEFFYKNIKKYIKKYLNIALENISELIIFIIEDYNYSKG